MRYGLVLFLLFYLHAFYTTPSQIAVNSSYSANEMEELRGEIADADVDVDAGAVIYDDVNDDNDDNDDNEEEEKLVVVANTEETQKEEKEEEETSKEEKE